MPSLTRVKNAFTWEQIEQMGATTTSPATASMNLQAVVSDANNVMLDTTQDEIERRMERSNASMSSPSMDVFTDTFTHKDLGDHLESFDNMYVYM
jgi:hypothetical protein